MKTDTLTRGQLPSHLSEMSKDLLIENARLQEQLRLANIDCFNTEADNSCLLAICKRLLPFVEQTPHTELVVADAYKAIARAEQP